MFSLALVRRDFSPPTAARWVTQPVSLASPWSTEKDKNSCRGWFGAPKLSICFELPSESAHLSSTLPLPWLQKDPRETRCVPGKGLGSTKVLPILYRQISAIGSLSRLGFRHWCKWCICTFVQIQWWPIKFRPWTEHLPHKGDKKAQGWIHL